MPDNRERAHLAVIEHMIPAMAGWPEPACIDDPLEQDLIRSSTEAVEQASAAMAAVLSDSKTIFRRTSWDSLPSVVTL